MIETRGEDLRALRKARGLTLVDLSDSLGKSVGWLSQVERNLSEPSISDLEGMAEALDVSVTSLFPKSPREKREEGYVVRSDRRRPLGSREPGLIEELLSPDLTDDFEVVHSVFNPGTELKTVKSRDTQELAYLVSGRLVIWIDGHRHEISAGDSFRIKGQPYRWHNPYDEPAVAIWVIAPPVY